MISVTDLNQQQYSENLYKTSGHWYELITEYKRTIVMIKMNVI